MASKIVIAPDVILLFISAALASQSLLEQRVTALGKSQRWCGGGSQERDSTTASLFATSPLVTEQNRK
ncbi:MAG: hypothetical protein WDN07_05045 [Actinomycetota bacterium]